MPIEIGFSDNAILRIEAMLSQLDVFDRGKALQGALMAASKPAVAKWKQLAPRPGKPKYTGPGRGRKRHGKGLADAIGAKTWTGRASHVAALIVGADYAIAPHEHLVELGHEIVTARGGKPTRSAFRGRTIIAPAAVLKVMRVGDGRSKTVSGGRVAGGHYGRTAIESTWGEFQTALTSHIQREIDRRVRGA